MSDKILLVDDEDMVRKFMRIHLEKDGYEVVDAENGEIAVKRLQEFNFSLVITDIKMPKMDGEVLLEYMQGRCPDIPVIILTGFIDIKVAIAIMKKGAFDYCIKPIKKEQLLITVKKGIQYRTLTEKNRQLEKENIEYQDNLKKKVSDQTATINNLLSFANQLNSLETLDEVLQATIDIIKEFTASQRISVMLLDEKNKYLTIIKSEGLPEDIVRNTKVRVGQGIAGKIIDENEVLVINDASHFGSNLGITEYDAFMATPLLKVSLRVQKNPLGVINITNKKDNLPYTEEDASIISCIADTVSVAINNHQNILKLRNSYLESIRALANTMGSKDPDMSEHCARIVNLAIVVAEKFDLSEDEKEALRFAAILHDIGKIGIKEDILMKQGKLTPKEYDEMKRHVNIGIDIIKPVKHLEKTIPLILHHHERYDGNGYPDGLKGESIPIGARIIGVIDAFDAMTSNRPYQEKMEIKNAISELKKYSGSQFDPKVVDILVDCIAKDKKLLSI